MSNKNQLQEIKDKFEWGEENLESGIYNVESDDIKWLIEQAEKVEQLQQEVQGLKAVEIASLTEINLLDNMIDKLKNQLQQAQEKIDKQQQKMEWLQTLLDAEKLNRVKTSNEAQRAQIKLNSIRFYVENPISDGKLAETILDILNDPDHDGI